MSDDDSPRPPRARDRSRRSISLFFSCFILSNYSVPSYERFWTQLLATKLSHTDSFPVNFSRRSRFPYVLEHLHLRATVQYQPQDAEQFRKTRALFQVY